MLNPSVLFKSSVLENIDGCISKSRNITLWFTLAVLAIIDVGTIVIDWIPLIDEMLIGGLAIKVSSELLRRRKELKQRKLSASSISAVKVSAK
jgi:hypothetical protein